MFGLLGLIRPSFNTTARIMADYQPSGIFVRTLIKSHKGAAKRWRKTANAFKRKSANRNHGNTGWSRGTLKSGGTKLSNAAQTKRLRKLLPYS